MSSVDARKQPLQRGGWPLVDWKSVVWMGIREDKVECAAGRGCETHQRPLNLMIVDTDA